MDLYYQFHSSYKHYLMTHEHADVCRAPPGTTLESIHDNDACKLACIFQAIATNNYVAYPSNVIRGRDL